MTPLKTNMTWEKKSPFSIGNNYILIHGGVSWRQSCLLSVGVCKWVHGFFSRWAMEMFSYFPWNPGCLIGILITVTYNPHTTDPLYALNKQGIFHCSDYAQVEKIYPSSKTSKVLGVFGSPKRWPSQHHVWKTLESFDKCVVNIYCKGIYALGKLGSSPYRFPSLVTSHMYVSGVNRIHVYHSPAN